MDYDQLFEEALELMATGQDYQASIALWQQAATLLQDDLDSKEERALIELNIALCRFELGQYGQVLSISKQWLDDPVTTHQSELGQSFLTLSVGALTQTGDLGQARALSEQSLAALESAPDESSPRCWTSAAEKRAVLARQMGRPDDAEDALALAFELLERACQNQELDAEERLQLKLAQAQLLTVRAHNRFEGHAAELAYLDLEDAVEIYRRELGAEHATTLETIELMGQVAQAY